MDVTKIPVGVNPPEDINVIIEIPMGGTPVKYEVEKNSGAMFVDRFLHTAMQYPSNYGFVPHTIAADGDALDVMVLSQSPVIPGAVIRSRPVGVLLMEDEAGGDEKIIAVPVADLHPYYDNINNIDDVRPILREQIAHFFEHYKDLEPGKWVKIKGWGDADEARRMVELSVKNAASQD